MAATGIDAIEERPAIQRQCLRGAPGLGGRPELQGVHDEAGPIGQRHVRPAGADRVRPQHASQMGEGFAQGMPRSCLVLVTPEHLGERFAREPLLRQGEDREHCQLAPLLAQGVGGRVALPSFQDEAPEGEKPKAIQGQCIDFVEVRLRMRPRFRHSQGNHFP